VEFWLPMILYSTAAILKIFLTISEQPVVGYQWNFERGSSFSQNFGDIRVPQSVFLVSLLQFGLRRAAAFRTVYGTLVYIFFSCKSVVWFGHMALISCSPPHFYRAMLCISAVYAGMRCLSVRPSVCLSRSWVLSKRINISSTLFHHG